MKRQSIVFLAFGDFHASGSFPADFTPSFFPGNPEAHTASKGLCKNEHEGIAQRLRP
jgi:hypothetical protein